MTELIPFIQPKRVMTRSFNNHEYKIRIARPITEIDDFEEEIMALEEASDHDVVFIQLSSPGGSLETCDFLCRRMNECSAPIVVEIGMTCASAASALMLQATDWIIDDSSTAMVHACSYSPGWGKEFDVRTSVSYTERLNREWIERTYSGFLTDAELQQVLDGKDLYFFADDLRERLPKYKEYRDVTNACKSCQCGDLMCGQGDPSCENCSDDFDDEPEFDLKSIIKEVVSELLDERGLIAPVNAKPTTKPKPRTKKVVITEKQDL